MQRRSQQSARRAGVARTGALSARGRQRARRRRGPSRLRGALFIVGIAVAFLGLVAGFLALFTNFFRPVPVLTNLPVSSEAVVEAGGESIYYMKGTTLTCVNSRGEEQWSSKFPAGQQSLAVSDSLICLYDSAAATVVDVQRNPLFTIPQSDFTILDVVCGRESIAVLCQTTDDGQTTQFLRLFDTSGKEISRIDQEKAEVLSFGFSGSGESLWYLTLDASGVEPVSQITTYNPAQNTMTGLYQIYDELVDRVVFYGGDMYTCGTTYLSVYDTFGKKKADTLTYGTHCAATYAGERSMLFAFAPYAGAEEDIPTVRVLSTGGVDTLLQLPEGVRSVALSESRLYAFCGSTVYVYQVSGEFEKTIELGLEAKSVRALTGRCVLVNSGIAQYLMNIE